MKRFHTPAIVLAALCIGFLIFLACSVSFLPERVAIHFGASGQPNDWLSRPTYLLVMAALGVGLSALIAVLALVVRFIPAQFFNLPHREYWMSPERKSQTCTYISNQLLWLACLEVAFFTVLHFLTIEANRMVPVQLLMSRFLPLAGGFLVAVALWIMVLIRHFTKVA